MSGTNRDYTPGANNCPDRSLPGIRQLTVRIRSNIFVWVFFATIVPLTALALGATYYSESTYQQDATRDVSQSLERLAAELKRNLDNYQTLTQGMARSPAVHDFLPALAGLAQSPHNSNINIHRSRVNHYFEGFQTILPGAFFLRIMDTGGNTLIKVSHQSRSAAVYESVSGISYVEQEISSPDFVKQLRQLSAGEVTAMRLPHNSFYPDIQTSLQLHDYVVPLYYKKKFIGALSLTLFGEQLDQSVRNATRMFNGSLFIVQNNPEMPERHGTLLYDDALNIFFIQQRYGVKKVGQYYEGDFMDSLGEQAFGEFNSSDNQYHYYYMELFPYGNLLSSWMLVTRIKQATISAPFNSIRVVIWLCAGIALIVSLLLASIGTRKVAKPVCELAGKLLAYANGNYHGRIQTKQGIDEIDSLTDAFNYMADTLHLTRQDRDRAEHMMLQNAKLASIGQMAAGIGHELNNPLNNILSYSKLVERNVLDDETTLKDIQSLREEALRASNIIKGILNFARQVPPEYSLFNVAEWLSDTLGLVRQMAVSSDVNLQADVEYAGEVEGDRGQLQQALVNLLLNAIQASERGSEVRVRLRRENDFLSIEVVDAGRGIDPAVLDNIFDPFFTTKAEGEGSGLGLSISLGIIERHGGMLKIDTHAGHGVCAKITLPLQARSREN